MLAILATCLFTPLSQPVDFFTLNRRGDKLELEGVSAVESGIVRRVMGSFPAMPATDGFWITSSADLVAVFEDGPVEGRITLLIRTPSKVLVEKQVKVGHRAFSIWRPGEGLCIFDDRAQENVSAGKVTVSFRQASGRAFQGWPELAEKASRLVELLEHRRVGTPIRGDQLGGFREPHFWPPNGGPLAAMNEDVKLFAVLRSKGTQNVVSVFNWSDGRELYSTEGVRAARSISLFRDLLVVVPWTEKESKCLVYRNGRLLGSIPALYVG
jgi:hypothetical protein